MLEDRHEFRRRARHHLNSAKEVAEDIREVEKTLPREKLARLRQLKQLYYMKISRISALELSADYLYRE
jgi:hypothetical protein